MKNLKISRVLFLLISFWFVVGLGQAVELGVVDLEVFYQKKVNSLREDLDKQIAAEHSRYLVEVQQSFAKFQKMGQLGPALVANREIEFLKKTIFAAREIPERPGLDEFGKALRLKERRLFHDSNIAKIKDRHGVQHREAAEKLIKLLQGKVKALTRQGKLEDAQEAQRFAESVRKEFPVEEKKADRPDAELEKRIGGSLWDYYDVNVYAKVPARLEIKKDRSFSIGGVTGKWKVTNKKKQIIELSASAWPSKVELTISEDFKSYEGKYFADGTRRHGKYRSRLK